MRAGEWTTSTRAELEPGPTCPLQKLSPAVWACPGRISSEKLLPLPLSTTPSGPSTHVVCVVPSVRCLGLCGLESGPGRNVGRRQECVKGPPDLYLGSAPLCPRAYPLLQSAGAFGTPPRETLCPGPLLWPQNMGPIGTFVLSKEVNRVGGP